MDGRDQYNECMKIVLSPGEDAVRNAWAFLVCSIIGFQGLQAGVSDHWTGNQKKNKTRRLRKLPEVLEQWRQLFLECEGREPRLGNDPQEVRFSIIIFSSSIRHITQAPPVTAFIDTA